MRLLPVVALAAVLATASGIAPAAAAPSSGQVTVDFVQARDVAIGSSSSSSSSSPRSEDVNGLFSSRKRRMVVSDEGDVLADERSTQKKRSSSSKARRSRKKKRSTCNAKAATTTTKTSSTTSSSSTKTSSTSSTKTSTSTKSTSTSTSTKSTSTSSSSSKSSSSTKSSTTSTTTSKATTTVTKTTTTTKTSTSTTSSSTSSSTMIMGGYWPNWVYDELPPSSIDWDMLDYVAYAFAVPSTTGTITLDSTDATYLKDLVTAGHDAGKKVICSLGGWDQSTGFSPSVSTDALRETFADNILAFIEKYDLDGIDLDWEYPNSADAGNYDSADTKNFQTFLVLLRETIGDDYLITAAVSQAPWINSSGGTVANVSRAASALDYIMIMNYDVNGVSSTPGPNAPLADLCGNSSQPAANAAAAVKQWGEAGMPRSQMILGVPYYGYVSDSSDYYLTDRRRSLHEKAGGKTGAKRTTTLDEGTINFNDIVSDGALTRSSATSFVATSGSGWTRGWDSCSDTPFLANGEQVIAYDDPTSLYDKAAFAYEAGLGGCATWSLDGDTSKWDLTASLLSGMGLSS